MVSDISAAAQMPRLYQTLQTHEVIQVGMGARPKRNND